MHVSFLNPFVEAVFEVLKAEANLTTQRGSPALQHLDCTPADVTVILKVAGHVQGGVLLGMSESLALSIASQLLKHPCEALDDLAKDGITEFGSAVAKQASRHLTSAGFKASISTPVLVLGKGTVISATNFHRVVVPLHTETDVLWIHLALRDSQTSDITWEKPSPRSKLWRPTRMRYPIDYPVL